MQWPILFDHFFTEDEEELDKFPDDTLNDDWKFAVEKMTKQISDQVRLVFHSKEQQHFVHQQGWDKNK